MTIIYYLNITTFASIGNKSQVAALGDNYLHSKLFHVVNTFLSNMFKLFAAD